MSCQFLASISTSWTQKASALSLEKHSLFDHFCFHLASNRVTGKSFLNLGRDPSGPLWMSHKHVLSFLTSCFEFTHLLSVQGRCFRCLLRGGPDGAYVGRELRCRRACLASRPDLKNVRVGVNGNGRCEMGGLCKHMYAYKPWVMHVCELQAKPAYKMWHSDIPLLRIRWGKKKTHLIHSYLGLHRCASTL